RATGGFQRPPGPGLPGRDGPAPPPPRRGGRARRGAALRLGRRGSRTPPQLTGADARRKTSGELLTIDEPLGLGIAADQRGGKEHALSYPPASPRRTSSCLSSQ